MQNTAKQYLLTVGGTLATVVLSGLFFWFITASPLFSTTFSQNAYSGYGVDTIAVERESLNGVPVSTVKFSLKDVETVDRNTPRMDSAIFSRIQNDIRVSLKEQSNLFMVEGQGEGLSYRFESVSEDDYLGDTFSQSYQDFVRMANPSTNQAYFQVEPRSIDYVSAISNQGERVIQLNIADAAQEDASEFAFKTSLDNLLQSLRLNDGTIYNLNYSLGSLSFNARFSTSEERDAILAMPDSMFATWSMVRANEANDWFTNISIQVPGNVESNRTTVMLTLNAEQTEKRDSIANTFMELALENPELAIPAPYTISFIVEGETTPFKVVAPTNRTD